VSVTTKHYSDGELAFSLKLGKHAWWSAFSNMAEIILVFLRQFKESKRDGIPGTMFDVTDPSVELTEEIALEWEAILDKMIYAFELIVLDNDDLPTPDVVECREKAIEDGLLEFAVHFRGLWD